MEKFDVLVVGGGFKAVAAAWGQAKAGKNVALVEVAPKIGGFLSPIHWDGYWIDKGPQFFDNFEPQDVDLINDMIGADIMEDIGFEYGSYMSGSLNSDFAIPDWQSKGDDFAMAAFQGLIETRLTSDAPSEFNTFDDVLAWDGGPVLLPLLRQMTQKFVGCQAEDLSPKAATMVTYLGRKKFFGQDLSLDLKKSPALDALLAAQKVTVGEPRANLYPRGSSLETVRVALEEALDRAGVTVFTEMVLTDFDVPSGVARGDGVEIEFDWVFFGTDIRATETLLTGGKSIDERTHVVPEIFHCYVVPAESVARPYYVVDYDPAHVSTRITNFCNYMGCVDDQGLGVICVEEPVEVGSERWNDPGAAADDIYIEALETGSVAAETYLKTKSFKVPVTYKIPLVGIEDRVDAFRDQVSQECGDRAIIPDAYGLTRKSAIDDLRTLGMIE